MKLHGTAFRTLLWKELLLIWKDKFHLSWGGLFPLVIYVVFYVADHGGEGFGSSAQTVFQFSPAAFALIFLTLHDVAFQALLLGGERLLAERQSGTLYTLLASPASALDVMAAAVVASLGFVIPTFGILIVLVFIIGWGASIVTASFVVVSITIAFHSAAFGVLLGTRMPSPGSLRRAGVFLWFVLMGLALAGDALPTTVDHALKIIPLYWGIRTLTDVVATGSLSPGGILSILYMTFAVGLLLHKAGPRLLPRTHVGASGGV